MKLQPAERKNIILCGVVAILVVVFDYWLKIEAVKYLKGVVPTSYWDGFVVIEYAENRGAFLSLGANLSDEARTWIFVVGVFFILIFCFYSLWKSIHDRWSSLAFSLVISGGIGNLIDRISQGYVVDYIHMGFGGLRTGVFNLADVAISGGLIFLLFFQYLTEKSTQSKSTENTQKI